MRHLRGVLGLALRRLALSQTLLGACLEPARIAVATDTALHSCNTFQQRSGVHTEQANVLFGSSTRQTACSSTAAAAAACQPCLCTACKRQQQQQGVQRCFTSGSAACLSPDREDQQQSPSDEDRDGSSEVLLASSSDEDLALSFTDDDFDAATDPDLADILSLEGVSGDEEDIPDLHGARSPLLGGPSPEYGAAAAAAAGEGPNAQLPAAAADSTAGIPAPGGGSWEDLLAAGNAREGLTPEQVKAKRAMLEWIVRGRYSVSPPREETLPEELQHMAHDPSMREFALASKKKKKFIMEQALAGRWGSMANRPEQQNGDAAPPDERFRDDDDPLRNFRMKIVDINRTSKGTKAGGVLHFTAMCVVGNGEGVLGHGTGRAKDVGSAVVKAHQRALEHLTYVPRYRGHTIFYPTKEKYGKSIVIMYPKSSGSGIKASVLVDAVCRLAGIKDVGVKVQGSRNARNTVKALFQAFDDMSKIDESALERPAQQQQLV